MFDFSFLDILALLSETIVRFRGMPIPVRDAMDASQLEEIPPATY